MGGYGGGGFGFSGILFLIAMIQVIKEENKRVGKTTKVDAGARAEFGCGADF